MARLQSSPIHFPSRFHGRRRRRRGWVGPSITPAPQGLRRRRPCRPSPEIGDSLYFAPWLPGRPGSAARQRLGFEQVEFFSGMLPLDASAEQIAAMKAPVAELGMSISAHGVNGSAKTPPPIARRSNLPRHWAFATSRPIPTPSRSIT